MSNTSKEVVKSKWYWRWYIWLSCQISKPKHCINNGADLTIESIGQVESLAKYYVNKWKYKRDPFFGIYNVTKIPYDAFRTHVGDCDDFASKMSNICRRHEVMFVTYFTKKLKYSHTVLASKLYGKYIIVNWGSVYVGETFDEVMQQLLEYGNRKSEVTSIHHYKYLDAYCEFTPIKVVRYKDGKFRWPFDRSVSYDC